jgi:hypothetical protein
VEVDNARNDKPITLSDAELVKRLDHLDELGHRTEQALNKILEFIEQNRPVLARATGLMDPGAKLRAAIGRSKRAPK